MCLTDAPGQPHPVPEARRLRPEAVRIARCASSTPAGARRSTKFDPIPNRKTDTNNHGPFSTDNIGMNYDYPEATYERRREIIKEHEAYQKGWLYFIANDPRVPEDVRRAMQKLGPGQGRVHRQRRLAAPDLRPRGPADDRRLRDDRERAAEAAADAGLGRHGQLQHGLAQRAAVRHAGRATSRTRATSASAAKAPYQIAYGSLVAEERRSATNLLVPVCVSQLAHRLRLDPDGAGLHDPRPVGGHGGRAGHRRRASPCRTCRTRSSASGCWRTARSSNTPPGRERCRGRGRRGREVDAGQPRGQRAQRSAHPSCR